MRLSFDVDGHLWVDHEGQWQDAGAYEAGKWQQIEITIPKKADSDRYEFKWNGQKPLRRDVVFAEPALSMERLSFRTGAYRARGEGGRDIPGGDKKVPAASFLVDDVVVTPDN